MPARSDIQVNDHVHETGFGALDRAYRGLGFDFVLRRNQRGRSKEQGSNHEYSFRAANPNVKAKNGGR